MVQMDWLIIDGHRMVHQLTLAHGSTRASLLIGFGY